LRLAESCPASQTAVTLDNPIDVVKFSEFFGFTIAASTVHLTFSGLALQWLCIFDRIPLKAKAFGCALPVLDTLTGLCFYFFTVFELRGLPFGQPPSFAFFRAASVLASDVALPPTRPSAEKYLRICGFIFIALNIAKPIGYCKGKMKLFYPQKRLALRCWPG
jgi:hypothetical protein